MVSFFHFVFLKFKTYQNGMSNNDQNDAIIEPLKKKHPCDKFCGNFKSVLIQSGKLFDPQNSQLEGMVGK